MSEPGGSQPIEFESISKQYSKEEQKLVNHSSFQRVACKFWALLPKDENGRVSKATYISLMKRIYMLLLPNYKKEEMETEILSEWNFD
jgi:hypothetical protein